MFPEGLILIVTLLDSFEQEMYIKIKFPLSTMEARNILYMFENPTFCFAL